MIKIVEKILYEFPTAVVVEDFDNIKILQNDKNIHCIIRTQS